MEEKKEKQEVTKNNTPVNKKKAGIIAGIVVGALLVVYVGLGLYFNNHFYIRSSVNGVPASFASAEKVAGKIAEAANGYTLQIVDGDKELLTIEPSDVDLTVEATTESVATLLNNQNGFLWVKYLFVPKNYTENSVVSLNDSKLNSLISDFVSKANKKATVETTDANVTFKGSEFVIVDEVYGNDFDAEQLYDTVENAILTMEPVLDASVDAVYKQPSVKNGDAELDATLKALNKKAGMTITYELGDENEVVSAEKVASWLSVNDNYEVVYDTEAMSEFVSEMAKKYNSAGLPKTLNSSYGTVVTVPAGNYGWKIDSEGELEQLKADLDEGKSVSRDFVYSQRAAVHGDKSTDYGNSYVEVNLSAQHLHLYVDGACVVETDFVSGNVSHNTITHNGAYFIAYKEKDATLRGADYVSHVKYWMPFHNGEGLHDATWRKAFGGDIYLTSGSHGCVNLPLGKAGEIFNNVSSGFPVLVYELPGTSKTVQYQSEAQPVMDLINAIGPVSTESAGAIANARNAYNALNDEVKSYVNNYNVLVDAENAYQNAVNAAAQGAQPQQPLNIWGF